LRGEGGGLRPEENRRVAEAMAPAAEAGRAAGKCYDEAALRRLAAGAEKIDMVWLANRSEVDPALVDSDSFLRRLFRPGERVVIFTDERSQGQAVWPDEPVPRAGARGMWFLIQPVTGQAVRVPRLKGPSRRAEECVTSWRYALIESDDAPVGLWLRWLVKLRLPVAAIYSSGGRSVHALVKVDAASKGDWDRLVGPLKASLRHVGADPGAMTGVRLSRLPGQWRAEKGMWQRLLYVNALPRLRRWRGCGITGRCGRSWRRRRMISRRGLPRWWTGDREQETGNRPRRPRRRGDF
jgi:hypothetical protein